MKERIQIDLSLAQTIINEKQKQSWGGKSPFFKAVSAAYNEKLGTEIDWQIFLLRCNSGVLTTTVGKARGVKNKQPKSKLTPHNQIAAEELRRVHGKRFPKLVKDAINGSRAAADKLHCIACVGADAGYRQTIRDCTCYSCPLMYNRPYQHGDEEENED